MVEKTFQTPVEKNNVFKKKKKLHKTHEDV